MQTEQKGKRLLTAQQRINPTGQHHSIFSPVLSPRQPPLKRTTIYHFLNMSPLTVERTTFTFLLACLLPYGTWLRAPAFCGSDKTEPQKVCADFTVRLIRQQAIQPQLPTLVWPSRSVLQTPQQDKLLLISYMAGQRTHCIWSFKAEQKKERRGCLFKKTVQTLQSQLSLLPLHKT